MQSVSMAALFSTMQTMTLNHSQHLFLTFQFLALGIFTTEGRKKIIIICFIAELEESTVQFIAFNMVLGKRERRSEH